jgi:hypothetical protein
MIDNQKDAEEDLRSQLSAADRVRVEAEIKRRKVEKEVSLLKGKIKAMFEADREDATEELDSTGGGRCDVEDSNGDDAGELPHRMSQHRERPRGLSYRLRHAATRATVRRYVRRKCDRIEQWLTQAVGNDDKGCFGKARRKRAIAVGRESTDASSCVRRKASLGSMLKFEQHSHPGL